MRTSKLNGLGVNTLDQFYKAGGIFGLKIYFNRRNLKIDYSLSILVTTGQSMNHIINFYLKSVLGKNRKSSTFFLIFCVPEVTKLTLTLFFEGIDLSDFFVLLH